MVRTLPPHKHPLGSEEDKEAWRVYFHILSRPYPTRQRVEATFKALADLGILADSFTRADVDRALAPYDEVDGLTITYPVKYAFLEHLFKGFAPKFAAVRRAGGPGHDVEALMMFHKDVEAIHDRFEKMDSGDTKFIIMAVDVGRADEAEWGSRHFWDDYDITETFLQLGVDGTFGVDVRILEKSIEEKTGLYPHTLIL